MTESKATINLVGSTSLPIKKYYSIGEVSKICGVESHVLRYWEGEFPQLNPRRHRGNRRMYQHKDIRLIQIIQDLLHTQGYTLQGARQYLSNTTPPSPKPSKTIIREVIKDLENILEKLV